MRRSRELGELQLAIMRVLWERGEATAVEVHAALASRAPTTIATMLSKMERKGVVTHRAEGRQFVWRATVSEADVQRTMVASLTDRLFQGDAGALVSHLVEEQEIDLEELERLRRRIERRQRGEDE